MQLNVENRVLTGKKVKQFRKEGKIPAIVYGKYLDDPVSILFGKNEFIKLYRQTGKSVPITLKGEDMDQMVLIQDIQVDPVTDILLHIDFLALKKGEKVTTEVEIVLTGESPIEKLGEGNVQQVKDSLEIEALPKDLPQNITVDISGLETLSDVIFVKDLDMPEGVEIKDDIEQPVVTVVAVSEEVEEEPIVEEGEGGEEGEAVEGEVSDAESSEGSKPSEESNEEEKSE